MTQELGLKTEEGDRVMSEAVTLPAIEAAARDWDGTFLEEDRYD